MLLLLLTVTAFVLVIISVRLKYQELTREKIKTEKLLKAEETLKDNLLAEYQTYSSKERIVKIAEKELGLKRRTARKVTITIDKKLVDKINQELKLKYE